MQENSSKQKILKLKFNSEKSAKECLSLLTRSGWVPTINRDTSDATGCTYFITFHENDDVAYEVAYMLTNFGYTVTMEGVKK